MKSSELSKEISRLKAEFKNSDESILNVLEGLIEQAAYERLYLKRLNEQAIITGLVKIHPEKPDVQKTLPVSAEIARHSAALTNIMDKLIKHLGSNNDDKEDELSEYE